MSENHAFFFLFYMSCSSKLCKRAPLYRQVTHVGDMKRAIQFEGVTPASNEYGSVTPLTI